MAKRKTRRSPTRRLQSKEPNAASAVAPERSSEPGDNEQAPRLPFAVVGIGASAGGLEAFTEFFKIMPADSGMAFVLVQHLRASRESLLADILSKQTEMPVHQIEDGMSIEPNHVYVIRPAHTLLIKDGLLHLTEPVDEPAHQRPVDDFFRSLAEEQRERAIGIIMSGMGSNGTAGAQTIKAVGGLCIAQDVDTAKFPSMPQHLIDGGMADFILRPQEMPEVLMCYAGHPYASGARRSAEALLHREKHQFSDILLLLRTRLKHDFSKYKKPTILRRIQRRMGLNQVTKLGEYYKLLRQSPTEITALSDDLLIHVTGFFRDPESWEVLRQRVIVPLLKKREHDSQVRCWVTACSSGEEAYTLAMLISEAADAAQKNVDVKIFATDTAERSLHQARNGVYPGGIESEIAPQRLKRFFDKEDAVYRVKKDLREMVVFAPQNVLNDPPFSRLDIITCRNLLIYLEPEMQRRVLSLLHFGLRENGALLLGTSETVSGAEELFHPIDKKWRIYRRIGVPRRKEIDFPLPVSFLDERDRPQMRATSKASVAQLTAQTLLARYTPATVVINAQHHVVYYHGDTEPFLSQPRGEPTRELLSVVRPEIRGAVRIALQKVMRTNQPAIAITGAITSSDHGKRHIVVTASLLGHRKTSGHFLISFEERPEKSALAFNKSEKSGNRKRLQLDLHRIREELQSTNEELQTSNEELKASNEEVISINEELQSTNEELETSKEELQSLNEELSTVNSQLQVKMEELEGMTNDLSSLLSSTDIAVLFLDTDFRIRRFTPAVKDLLDLIPSDLGRPISALAAKFTDPQMLEDAREVLRNLAPIGREIVSQSGRWYVRRILPYRTADNRIAGIVITFVDISERKNAEEGLLQAKLAAEDATRLKDQFLATLSHELRTPLTAILLWTRILSEKKVGEEKVATGLKIIERSAEAQKKMVDDLLDSSRITSGKLRLETTQVDLSQLVQSAVDMIRPIAYANGVNVVIELDPNIGIVSADADRLRQVLMNLLSNAIKFTRTSDEIRVALQRFGDDVELRVADTGQGIAPEFLPQVFTAFRQADASSTRRYGGLGLGLAISKQLVELHHGTIFGQSDGVGRGATFIVRLPLPAISEPAHSPAHHDDEKIAGEKIAGQKIAGELAGLRILFVEDENDIRIPVTDLLKKSGAAVTAAASAREAIDAYKKSRPDLIVSDLAMPEMDGWAMLREIRSWDESANAPLVPAIALSAFARDEDQRKALAAGFQHFFRKPMELDQLLTVVKKLVRGE